MMVLEENRGIRDRVIESLCLVRAVDRTTVDSEIAASGGDLRIDSKEGEAICAMLEDSLALGELVQPTDLMPEELTSVASLSRLFERRVNDRVATTGQEQP